VDGDPRPAAAGDGVSPVHLEEERPWRCPACGYDVRGVPFGGRCSECGEAIDERSFRPRWMRREFAGRLWTWAVVASVANAMPALSVIALLVASAWSGAGGGGGGWVVLFLFSVAVSPVVQWIARRESPGRESMHVGRGEFAAAAGSVPPGCCSGWECSS
jgi:DNA-directed RNA polymerase subunit RPC12/RpoP